jgi:hypothetical protein
MQAQKAVHGAMKRERELQETGSKPEAKPMIGGWAGWLLAKLRTTGRQEPRLQLLERITLAPRQSLALVEADGRRLLVATSADGGPAFYPLDSRAAGAVRTAVREHLERSARISW